MVKYRRIGAFLFWGGYQLVDDVYYQTPIEGYSVQTDLYSLSIDGLLTIHKWYAWDGPTGAIKTKTFVAASLVHDVLCEMINSGLLPDYLQCVADEEMYKITGNAKMCSLRRAWAYRAVRIYQLKKQKGYRQPIYEVAI